MHGGYGRLALLAVVLLVALLGAYWGALVNGYRDKAQHLEHQTQLRSSQLAQTLAVQVQTLFAGLDFLTLNLAAGYASEDVAGFELAVHTATSAYPAGAILQVAVANREGQIVYSNLQAQPTKTSIHDRAHFRVHADAPETGLYISQPLMGRVSKAWTIQTTRAIRKNGSFEGVVVVSIAPSYLSSFFREILEDPSDVIMLLRNDGAYMARSRDENEALGTSVPSVLEFVRDAEKTHGFYEAQPEIDGVTRYYAWHRVHALPLVVSMGLSKEAVWAPLNAEIRDSVRRNGFVTVMFVGFALLIAWLGVLRRKARRDADRSTKLLRGVLDGSAASILLATSNHHLVQVNQRAQNMFGTADKPLLGQSLRTMHTDEASFEAFGACYEALRAQGSVRREWQLQFGDGTVRWCEVYASLLDSEDPEGQVIWTIVDVDERYRAAAALRAAQRRLTALIEHFPGGVMVQERLYGPVVAMNQRICDLLGLREPVAEFPPELVRKIEALLPARMLVEPEAPASAHTTVVDRVEQLLPDGRTYEVHRVPLWEGTRPLGLFWMLSDITLRKQRESALEHLAATDTLTQLPNRRAFLARLEQEWSRVQQGQAQPGVLLMIDIDFFKRVNDTWGHAVGDQVLKHLAALLQQHLRGTDMAGRLGGEEFAVLLPQTPIQAGLGVAEQLREVIAATPAVTDQGAIAFAVSIGVSSLSAGLANTDQGLEQADAALYYAKRHGRNQVREWQEGMDVVASTPS